jgi:hypothetical protein
MMKKNFETKDLTLSLFEKIDNNMTMLISFLDIFCKHENFDFEEIKSILNEKKDKKISEMEIFLEKNILGTITKSDLEFFYKLKDCSLFLNIWRENIPKVKVSLNDTKSLISLVKIKWFDLYMEIKNMSINTIKFENFINIKTFKNDLELLNSTYNGEYKYEENSFANIEKFKNFVIYKNNINNFEEIFKLKNQEDNFQKFEKNDFKVTLKEIIDDKEEFDLFVNFNDYLLSLMSQINQNKNIINWILKFDNDDEFNNLISICKTYSDDIIIIDTLNSVTSFRNYFYKILYSKFSTSNIETFKKELLKLNIITNEETIKTFETIKRNFYLLLNLIEEKTKSIGIQALSELEEVIEFGSYILTPERLKEPIFILNNIKKAFLNLDSIFELRNKLVIFIILFSYWWRFPYLLLLTMKILKKIKRVLSIKFQFFQKY